MYLTFQKVNSLVLFFELINGLVFNTYNDSGVPVPLEHSNLRVENFRQMLTYDYDDEVVLQLTPFYILGNYCTVKFGGIFHLLGDIQGFLSVHSIIFPITSMLVNKKSSLVTQLMELLWFG